MDCPPKKRCCREVAVVERWPFNSGGSTVMKNDCCINIFLIQYIKKKQMGKKATGRRKNSSCLQHGQGVETWVRF